MSSRRIDFSQIARAALAQLDSLLMEWLPQGHREGHEYKALNPTRGDSREGSFSINLNTGAWADFATDDKGGDAISLYAYLHGVSQAAAAKAMARRLGIVERSSTPAGAPQTNVDRLRTEWIPIIPVPENAPAPPKAHVKRRYPEATWSYRDQAGRLLGLIYRFRTSDGGKEVLPCCYAQHSVTKACEWRWLAFPEPRPLYGLPGLDNRPVLLVEGEKCVDAARQILGEANSPLAVLSWPGGSKAVDKANWSPLAGRSVLIWPDCDAQRHKHSKEILPESAQPGIKAAERIAAILSALVPPAQVKIVAIPKPGERAPGWDVADAVAEGWSREQILDFLRAHQRAPGECADAASTQGCAPAEAYDPRAWRRAMIWSGKTLKDCRENVIYILRDHPDWRGVLGANMFAKTITIRGRSPLGHPLGAEWTPDDDIRVGLWLAAQEDQLVVRSPDTIRQAVQHVAKLASFHPVREFCDKLVWDERTRIDTWTTRLLGSPDTPYTRLVSRFFLINLPRRVYEPGCIMRSVPVLEGPQDKGKSTALRVLVSPWFSDTTFRVGDKDSFQQIQGIWVYEISELESFTRAEATAVKAFISSVEDNFRAPYERQNEKHKRQTVFAATTNAAEYLKDWTGNTRFWPLPTGSVIDLDGLAAEREQLLAEAMVLYRARARTYPTAEEQTTLFKPEQDKRTMMHPWQDIIFDRLERDPEWKYQKTVSVRQVLGDIIKVDLTKLNPQGSEAQRVGQILHAAGWRKQRASECSRSWVWARPEEQAAVSDAHDEPPIPF